MPDFRSRIRAATRPERDGWYRIRNAAGSRTARVDIYDEIGASWWGGVDAKTFVSELNELDVDTIDLHINSPGGDVFDGIAITNALRDHPAQVVATVDGLAASAASFILQAADDRVMNRNTQLMIHDPWGFALGNAADMRAFADQLDTTGASIAGIYADRSGGSVDDWREAMLAETWYTAEEAVEAGLADSVKSTEDTEDGAQARARWDLSVFAHAGREAAPAPKLPARSPGTPPERTPTVAEITDEELTELRTAVGVGDDADVATVLAALREALDERADEPEVTTEAADLVDQVNALRQDNSRMSGELAAIRAERAAEARASFFAEMRNTGRLRPADEAQWAERWDRPGGPEFVRDVLSARAVGSEVPIAETGYTGGTEGSDPTEADKTYAALFGADNKVSA